MNIHRMMMRLARFMAILGGLVLTALIVLTCVSVLGRGINTFLHWDVIETAMPGLSKSLLDWGVGPILGDTELVEVGMAFAILSFFPFCQITAGHATVDIFTANFPAKVNRVLQAITDIVFAGVLILIAARLWAGMEGKMDYNETSFLLQYPIWWGFAAAFAAAAAASVVGIYVAIMRVIEMMTARMIIEGGGAEH